MNFKYCTGLWLGGLTVGLALPSTAIGRAVNAAQCGDYVILVIALVGIAMCRWGRKEINDES